MSVRDAIDMSHACSTMYMWINKGSYEFGFFQSTHTISNGFNLNKSYGHIRNQILVTLCLVLIRHIL